MLFFKYYKPGILERNMRRRGEVFFASRSELNNANEFVPRLILNGSVDHWERLSEGILAKVSLLAKEQYGAPPDLFTKLRPFAMSSGLLMKKTARNPDLPLDALGNCAADAFDEKILLPVWEKNRQHIRTLVLNVCSRFEPEIPDRPRYVTSFSLDAANPTMGGHYGGAEKGFVVIYESALPVLKVHSPVKILRGFRRGCGWHPAGLCGAWVVVLDQRLVRVEGF